MAYTEAFLPRNWTVVGNQKTRDTVKKASLGFTALMMASVWWNKLREASKTNSAHVLRR